MGEKNHTRKPPFVVFMGMGGKNTFNFSDTLKPQRGEDRGIHILKSIDNH
ncbi:MAG: hypothetical protein QGG48_04845 [Desulfatiglandales bacterium]|nr:hypothetical protein [Desulfatiglandales bacterium]